MSDTPTENCNNESDTHMMIIAIIILIIAGFIGFCIGSGTERRKEIPQKEIHISDKKLIIMLQDEDVSIQLKSIKNSNNNKDKSQKEITVNQEELINMLQNKDNYKIIIKDNN